MAFVDGFLIPLVEVVFIGGIISVIGFFVIKAFYNAWSKAGQFILKYKILKKPYPETNIKWILECMEQGVGWYDAKRLLFVGRVPTQEINEILWIYDQIIIEMKGGNKNHGRKFKGSNSKIQSQSGKLPSISRTC